MDLQIRVCERWEADRFERDINILEKGFNAKKLLQRQAKQDGNNASNSPAIFDHFSTLNILLGVYNGDQIFILRYNGNSNLIPGHNRVCKIVEKTGYQTK
jgi:hypothetical protein